MRPGIWGLDEKRLEDEEEGKRTGKQIVRRTRKDKRQAENKYSGYDTMGRTEQKKRCMLDFKATLRRPQGVVRATGVAKVRHLGARKKTRLAI